jgi:hypothetical protein
MMFLKVLLSSAKTTIPECAGAMCNLCNDECAGATSRNLELLFLTVGDATFPEGPLLIEGQRATTCEATQTQLHAICLSTLHIEEIT